MTKCEMCIRDAVCVHHTLKGIWRHGHQEPMTTIWLCERHNKMYCNDLLGGFRRSVRRYKG